MKQLRQYGTINSTQYFVRELIDGEFDNNLTSPISIEQYVCVSIQPDCYMLMNTKNQSILTISVANKDYFSYISLDQFVLRYILQIVNIIKTKGSGKAYLSKEFSLLIKILTTFEVQFNKVISLVAHYQCEYLKYRSASLKDTRLFILGDIPSDDWKFHIFDKQSDESFSSIRNSRFIHWLECLIKADVNINFDIITPVDESL